MSRLAWLFVALTTVFLAAGSYFSLRSTPTPIAEPNFLVADNEQDVGEKTIGIHEITLRLTNPSPRPRRVIGMTELCAGSYCFMMRHPNETTVQPGETCTYKYDLLIKSPGPFRAEGTLFLEGNGLQEVPLVIRGTAIVPQRRPSGPKPTS